MTGFYEEVIRTVSNITVTYRVYAHQFYSRLLVTDVIVDRSSLSCNTSSVCCNSDDTFTVSRTDLNDAPDEADFDWEPPSNYTESTYCRPGLCLYDVSLLFDGACELI